MFVTLNTQGMIDNLSGKNKAFISRVAKQQEEKYGNVDIFDASISPNEVRISFGDYTIYFFFHGDEKEVCDTSGNGQGHKYHKSLQACAEELYAKLA